MDLHHRLRRREAMRGGDFFDERLDVRAEELGRPVAPRADQVEVPRMPFRGLEARAAFAEVDLARETRCDHPLQRAVHGRAADAGRLAPHDRDEILGAGVSLLTKERVDDAIALGGVLDTRRSRWRLGELVTW